MAVPRRDRLEQYSKPILVSQGEAGYRLGISRTTIWRLAQAGQLEVVHIGSRALITNSSIDRFILNNTASDQSNERPGQV